MTPADSKLSHLNRFKKNGLVTEGSKYIEELLNDPELTTSEKFFSAALSFCYLYHLEELFTKISAVAEERGVDDFRIVCQKLAFLVATKQTNSNIEKYRQVVLSQPENMTYREIYVVARSYQIERQEALMNKFLEEELQKRLPGPYTEKDELKAFIRALELYIVSQNAVQNYDAVLKIYLSLKDLEVPVFVGSIINTISLALFKLERLPESLELLEKATLEGLHGSRAVGNVLRLLLQKGEHEKAWEVVEKKMMLPNLTPDPFTTSSLISLLLQRGEEGRAWDMYNVVFPEQSYQRLAPVYLANFVIFYSDKRSIEGIERVLKESQKANASLSMPSYHHMIRTVVNSNRTDLAESIFAAALRASEARKQPITAQLPLLMAQLYSRKKDSVSLQKYLDMVNSSPSKEQLNKHDRKALDQLKNSSTSQPHTTRSPLSQKIKNLLIFEKGNGDSVSE